MTDYSSIIPREPDKTVISKLCYFELWRNGGLYKRFYPGAGSTLHFGNREADVLTLVNIPPGFILDGDTVCVYYQGNRIFKAFGVYKRQRHYSRGSECTETVSFASPWANMERLVYRQWWRYNGTYVYSSRLILNQYKDGSPQTLRSELLEIAKFGQKGCRYTVDTSTINGMPNVYLPFDECRDITVADAIKRELRFFPLVFTRFNYSPSTPELYISGSAGGLSIPEDRILSRDITYNQQRINTVKLEVETTTTINGEPCLSHKYQLAGPTADDNANCLYATIQANGGGSNATYNCFESITEAIPDNLNDAQWWIDKHPRLSGLAPSGISISGAKREPANYNRISASTAGELEAAGIKCEVSKFTCSANISSNSGKENQIELTMFFLTTNATGTAEDPKHYYWLESSSASDGEIIPEGLARAILDQRSKTILNETLTIRLGGTLPKIGQSRKISDDESIYLQSMDIDLYNLTATLNFGVPDYQTPEDMVSLLRGFRSKCASSSSIARQTGKPDRGNKIQHGGIMPLSSTEFCPGTYEKLLIKGEDTGTGGTIDIDSKKVNNGKTVSINSLIVDDKDLGQIISTDTIKIKLTKYEEGNGIRFEKIYKKDEDGNDTDEIDYIKIHVRSDCCREKIRIGGQIEYNTENHYLSQKIYDMNIEYGLITSLEEAGEATIQAVEESV